MTRIFDESGNHVAVTLIQVGPCWVTQVKTIPVDGYNAIQISFHQTKAKSLNSPKLGHLKKANVEPMRFLKEFKVEDISEFKAGDVLRVDRFEIGQRVTISGSSKGRGFAGVMKRHGFHGAKATHGTHENKRHPGSIGAHTDPGKVWKGQKLPGHMGDVRISTKNLSIIKIDAEQNLLAVNGAVPGAPNSLLEIVLSN